MLKQSYMCDACTYMWCTSTYMCHSTHICVKYDICCVTYIILN